MTAPQALQIRVAPRYDERVAVGAPVPPRPLTPDEVDANVAHFTEGLRGPRTRPVRQLVLSGLRDVDATALEERVERWRSQGIEELVVHVGAGRALAFLDGPLGGLVDRVVVSVAAFDDDVAHTLAALEGRGGTSVSVLWGEAVRERLGDLVRCLAAHPPGRLAFVWPFPATGTAPPPDASDMVAELQRHGALALPEVSLVHVPACLDPTRRGPQRRPTANRWYVDADHQLGEALSFFPELVQLAKPDSCRTCRADHVCGGVARPWLEQGRTGVLEPL